MLVERPQPPPAPIGIPWPEPVGPVPFRVSVTVKRGPDPGSSARLRFLPARSREDLTFPITLMRVPAPPDAAARQWGWTTWLAGSRLNVVELPDEYLAIPSVEHRPISREAIHTLVRQIEQHGGRRH